MRSWRALDERGSPQLRIEKARRMPIEARVDERQGLVEIVATGRVTRSDFWEAMDRYFPASWSALPFGLFDLREVTATDVCAALVQEAARRAADQVDPRVEGGKLAIIALRDLVFGLGRMYEMLRDDSPVEVRVFRDRCEAERWLGLR